MPEIDRTSRLYPYEQIAAWITHRIHNGDLRPGMPIPSETTLQQEFPGTARTTIRRAVRHLRDLGLVETLPRRGTYVLPPQDHQ
ncbi:winged helix-turn-helix domain-containing protein [Actinomadura sp. GTD37]|uniref:winged helix-turn-helix domain-containing protein n=1 Tax=Actinomadura sp. GTD37 TaxID=1778030 RepID=UPI0035C0F2B5